MSKDQTSVRAQSALVAQPGKAWATVRLTGRGVTISAGGQQTEVPLTELLDRFTAEHPEVPLSRPEPIT